METILRPIFSKVRGDPDGDQYADPGGGRKVEHASSRNM
jgi:hypothetical protein